MTPTCQTKMAADASDYAQSHNHLLSIQKRAYPALLAAAMQVATLGCHFEDNYKELCLLVRTARATRPTKAYTSNS